MAKAGQPQAASLWASSGLQWSDFLQETPLDQFLRDNKLEWTMKVRTQISINSVTVYQSTPITLTGF